MLSILLQNIWKENNAYYSFFILLTWLLPHCITNKISCGNKIMKKHHPRVAMSLAINGPIRTAALRCRRFLGCLGGTLASCWRGTICLWNLRHGGSFRHLAKPERENPWVNPSWVYMNPWLVGFSMNPLGCMDCMDIEMAYVNGNPATFQKNDLRSVQETLHFSYCTWNMGDFRVGNS